MNSCLICRHPEFRHRDRNYTGQEERLSWICYDCNEESFKKYHVFKLDNLKLVEDLAKQKGLV